MLIDYCVAKAQLLEVYKDSMLTKSPLYLVYSGALNKDEIILRNDKDNCLSQGKHVIYH